MSFEEWYAAQYDCKYENEIHRKYSKIAWEAAIYFNGKQELFTDFVTWFSNWRRDNEIHVILQQGQLKYNPVIMELAQL